MRRFSQKHQLTTLGDINVTPLLDLSFVLLIIFMITTPLLEQGVTLERPGGGTPDAGQIDPDLVHVIDVTPEGTYLYRRERVTLEELRSLLAEAFAEEPGIIPYIRADRNVIFDRAFRVHDMIQKLGITTISYRSNVEDEP